MLCLRNLPCRLLTSISINLLGRTLPEQYLKPVHLKYFVDANVNQALNVKNEIGADEVICIDNKNLSELYKDKGLSGVVVCTPTHTHEKIVIEALEAGKSVLCEKPLSSNVKGIQKCYKRAEENGLTLLCAFNRRFDPQLQNIVNNLNFVGKIHSVKTCARDNPRPSIDYLKISGGIFHDCAVHDIDLTRWILQENPVTVYSTAHCNDDEIAKLHDVDTVFIVMKFPSGVITHIDLARECSYGYHQTVEVFGKMGSLKSGNVSVSSSLYSNSTGIRGDVIHPSFKQRYAESYKNEIEHFVDLIKGEVKTPKINLSDTIMATVIADACEESYRTGTIITMNQKYSLIPENLL